MVPTMRSATDGSLISLCGIAESTSAPCQPRLSARPHDPHIGAHRVAREEEIPMRTMTDHQQIIDIAETALHRIGDQTLLTQGHCVNVLLDLYCATEDFSIRWAIADRLDDIRFLSAVEGDEMRADLAAIIAIASADVPSDLEWSRSVLETCLAA
jgi:hypothetical protein